MLIALEQAKPEDLKDAASRKKFIQSLPEYVKGCYGGNSSCIHVEADGRHLVFDAGTGLRELGRDWMKREFGEGEGKADIFITHTHWDHIMGIPFFVPMFIGGNQFTVCSPFPDLRKRLQGQQEFKYFPVSFDSMHADIDFVDLNNHPEYKVGNAKVTWKEMYHPGKSFAYRVDFAGNSFVFATDSEYKQLGHEALKPAVDFFRGADMLVFDSQYTFIEGIEKEDWGHSSTFIGVDIAVEAGVKHIVFFHHEPTYSDFKLAEVLENTEKYLKVIAPNSKLKMSMAREGWTVDLL